jgi:hypothetical protein
VQLPPRSALAVSFVLLLWTACDPASPPATAPEPVQEPAAPGFEPSGLKPFAEEGAEDEDGSGQPTYTPGAGLDERPVWTAALELAAEAQVAYEAAEEAHRRADREALNRLGGEARTLYDRALEDTALFESEIQAAHGERDPQVRAIVAMRSTWFDRLRWLHKTVGR